jgi:predicted permease
MPLLPTRLRRISRRLGRAPLFAAAAIITLGVGIGANTAIFSVVYGVLLKPLPFEDPEGLVGVWHTAPGLGFPMMNQGPATYMTYREEGRTFEDLGMWDNTAVSITGSGEPERVDALLVTDGTLSVLRVNPALGRRFTADDDSTRSAETVMLTHAYWERKFGSDPNIIGRQVTVEGRPREIIGVLPASFKFLNYNPQLLLPFRWNRAEVFVGNFSYQAIARLKPGVTIEQANADIARMIPLVIEKFPLPQGFTRTMFEEVKMGPLVRPLSMDVIGDIGRVLWVLLGTVGIILLIACANVANLFLVRAEGRQQEIAVHAALGASRRQIAWELLSESLTLGVLGGAAGLLLAYAGLQVLAATAPEGLPRVSEIGLDPIVIAFTVVLSVVAGLLFGLLPVLKFARPRLANALKEGGRLSSDGRERHRARNTLVVAEIALAVVLLVGSGLMIRTFQAMRTVQPGFTNPEEVITFRISVPEGLVPDRPSITNATPAADALAAAERVTRTHEQILRRIEQIPGVTAVALTSSVTMDGNDSNDPIFVEEFPGPAGRIPPLRRFKWISEKFFSTMGNRIVAGRDLTWSETYAHHPVVLVNETFAREYWKDPRQAVGKRITQNPLNPWRTIVGVVADERDDGAARPAPAIVYWPMMVKDYWTMPVLSRRTMAYVVRTGRPDSPTLLKEIQQAVWSVNPGLPLANVMTLDEIRAGSMAQTSFALVMLAIAAGVALLLGVVGIYGVIAYVATQRTREIGIRIALGANQRDVSGLFIRHGLLLAVTGVTIGLIAAVGSTRVMSSMLFGVTATDPITYLAVALGLGGTAVLASYIPARRAARIDPASALRWNL